MLSVFVIALMTAPQAEAVIPKLITYHGILKNNAGSFLTGTYSMQFKLYDASTGGNNLWTETQSSVSVSSGRFNVQLGSVTTLNLSFTQDYWLSVKVGTDQEMTPRVRLTSAGYSYLAEDVTGGKLTGSVHAADSHMSIEGVRSAHTNIAKTNFKLDAYTQASANNMGDLIVDSFTDATGIDASQSSDYTWRGSPNYDVVAGSIGGIDSYTVLMLHMNGTDGSSSFTDSSSGAKGVTALGNAQIDNTQSKFGGTSGYFNGVTGTYLAIPDHADFDFGTGDFTVDFWVRYETIIAGDQEFFSHDAGSTEFSLSYNENVPSLQFMIAGGNSYQTVDLNTGIWYHIAYVRSGTSAYIFKDGIQLGTASTNSGNANSTAGITIGANNGGGDRLNGWIDELRVSKGVARWTTNFTPPTSEYTVPGGGTAAVISTTFSEPAAPSEAIVIGSQTLGTGSITYYVSRNNGTNWTQCTNEQVCNLSSQPSGTQIRWKASITGNAELDAIAVAL